MANSIVAFSKELAQQLVESDEQFPVDFDLAWVWMGYTRRDVAKRLLMRFGEGKDFHSEVEKSAGRSIQRFWLTIDCFKSLAMMVQTEKGDQVRKYFLECERKVKQQQQPMSQLELAVFSAQRLLEQETRINAIEVQNQLLIRRMGLKPRRSTTAFLDL